MNPKKLVFMKIAYEKYDVSDYGFPSVSVPSKFIPDDETNTEKEIQNWLNDLKREQSGDKKYSFRWGLGTNFGKSMPIDELIDIYN